MYGLLEEPEDFPIVENGELTTVIGDMKQRLEIDDNAYDEKLLTMVNSAIATLQLNGVPVSGIATIDSRYEELAFESYQGGYLSAVLDFLEVHLTLNFDRGEITGIATIEYLQNRYQDLLYMLKGAFDVAKKDQPFAYLRQGQYDYRRGTTIGDRDDNDARNTREDF